MGYSEYKNQQQAFVTDEELMATCNKIHLSDDTFHQINSLFLYLILVSQPVTIRHSNNISICTLCPRRPHAFDHLQKLHICCINTLNAELTLNLIASTTVGARINPQATNVIYIYIYIYGAPILDVSRSHTTTQHSRQDSSGRVISSSQRPLPDKTRHSQQTNIHAPGGIRTQDLSR